MLTHGELFAGISGFGLGFEESGIVTKWRCEIDIKPRAVLREHYPDDLLVGDITKVTGNDLEPVDIISFGSPCQGMSVAGLREGLRDERSILFFQAVRLVSELRPAFAVWENVPGAFSSDQGRDFLAVLRAFHELGARDIAWRVLDAQYDGVAQRRERIFLIADFRGERAGEILFESPCVCGNPAPSREARAGVAAGVAPSLRSCGVGTERIGDSRGQDCVIPCVTHCLKAEGHDASEDGTGRGVPLAVAYRTSGNCGVMEQGDKTAALNCGTDPNQTIVAYNIVGCGQVGKNHAYESQVSGCLQHKGLAATGNEAGTLVKDRIGVRRLTPRECERLQGFPDDWTRWGIDEKGKRIEIADGPRYRMLGNAVCRNSAMWLGKRILASL